MLFCQTLILHDFELIQRGTPFAAQTDTKHDERGRGIMMAVNGILTLLLCIGFAGRLAELNNLTTTATTTISATTGIRRKADATSATLEPSTPPEQYSGLGRLAELNNLTTMATTTISATTGIRRKADATSATLEPSTPPEQYSGLDIMTLIIIGVSSGVLIIIVAIVAVAIVKCKQAQYTAHLARNVDPPRPSDVKLQTSFDQPQLGSR